MVNDNTENMDAAGSCGICAYDGDKLRECPGCEMMLCGECHNAHADDIQFEGQCDPDLI